MAVLGWRKDKYGKSSKLRKGRLHPPIWLENEAYKLLPDPEWEALTKRARTLAKAKVLPGKYHVLSCIQEVEAGKDGLEKQTPEVEKKDWEWKARSIWESMRPKASGIDDGNGKGERREEKGSAKRMEGLAWRGFQGDLPIRKWAGRVAGLIRKREELIWKQDGTERFWVVYVKSKRRCSDGEGTPCSWEWYTGVQQSKRLNQIFGDHLPRNEGWNLRNGSDGPRREQIQRQVSQKEPRRTAASKGWEEEKSQWKQERMENRSEHKVTGICGWGASWKGRVCQLDQILQRWERTTRLRKGHEIGQQCSPWWHSGEQFSCSRSASE